jgi:hypothetical protein
LPSIKQLVLRHRRELYKAVQAAGLSPFDVFEKVDRRFPYGSWKFPVQVWTKDGKYIAKYWLTYPKGEPIRFNLETFEAIATWLKTPQKLSSPPSIMGADS